MQHVPNATHVIYVLRPSFTIWLAVRGSEIEKGRGRDGEIGIERESEGEREREREREV